VIAELQNGYLKIGDIQTKLLAKDPQKIVDQGMGYPGWILRLGEYAEYDCYGATSTMDYTPAQVLSNFQIFASSLGLRDFDELARSWLGLDSSQYSTNVHIIIPIYATVGEIQYQGGNEIKATLKMDQRLFKNSTIWLRRQPQDNLAPILERIKYDATSCENVTQDGFVYISLRHRFSGMGLYDRISISLLHNELGLLRQEETSISIDSAASDPLSKTFALFDAGKKMEEYLLDAKDDDDFVSSVSWLLEIVDMRAIKLAPAEAVRENKHEKGSADIIAYDSQTHEIFAIDCTIGVPQSAKIDNIKNTADYISRKITLPVKAVIVTAKKCPTAKEDARKNNVKIIDYADLEKIIGLCKKRYTQPAKNAISDP